MRDKLKYMAFAALILAPSLSFSAEAAGSKSDAPLDRAAARITGSTTYISVHGLSVSVGQRNGISGMIAVDLGLEVADEDKRKFVRATMPRVKDAARRSIQSFMTLRYEIGTVPDLEAMGAKLQKDMNKLIGSETKVTIASALVHGY